MGKRQLCWLACNKVLDYPSEMLCHSILSLFSAPLKAQILLGFNVKVRSLMCALDFHPFYYWTSAPRIPSPSKLLFFEGVKEDTQCYSGITHGSTLMDLSWVSHMQRQAPSLMYYYFVPFQTSFVVNLQILFPHLLHFSHSIHWLLKYREYGFSFALFSSAPKAKQLREKEVNEICVNKTGNKVSERRLEKKPITSLVIQRDCLEGSPVMHLCYPN